MSEINAGSKIGFHLSCPACGIPDLGHYEVSDFFILKCGNNECDMYRASILVERRTGQVLSVSNYYGLDNYEDRKRLYPAVCREDGTQVWPAK